MTIQALNQCSSDPNKKRPYLIFVLSNQSIDNIKNFILENEVKILNIAGPREEQSPGIYSRTVNMHTILITGANRGIGLELVKQYFQAGWEVLACYRDSTKATDLRDLATQSQERIKTFQLDVVNPQHVQTLADELKNKPIDVLINNAGVLGSDQINSGSVSDKTAECLEVFKINTIAPLQVAQAFIASIATSKLKQLINVSSVVGSIAENTDSGYCIYRASKAALNSITKNLSTDLKPQGITVIALHPGWVKTDMGGESAPITTETSAQGIKNLLSSLSLKDTGSFLGYDGRKIPW